MALFESWQEELKATEGAALGLLRETAGSTSIPDDNVLARLERLAGACARIAYGNGATLGEEVHNLIAWCDHLDDLEWRAQFAEALRHHPLRSPWSVDQ